MADVSCNTNLVSSSASSSSCVAKTYQGKQQQLPNRLQGFPLKLRPLALRSKAISFGCDFLGDRVSVHGNQGKSSRGYLLQTSIKAQCSSCLGCFRKPTLITSLNESSKGQTVQAQAVKKPSISEDFWTTSTCDMDNSAVQSQGSMSSISTVNQTLDPHSSGSSAPPEFVNHGLLLWNQTRHRWVSNKRSTNPTQVSQEPKLNWNATYENLLGSNKPFPHPIPLSEMVDFLVDVWEQEGMYD